MKQCRVFVLQHSVTSRPAWGAWIETDPEMDETADTYVAPRMGRVD